MPENTELLMQAAQQKLQAQKRQQEKENLTQGVEVTTPEDEEFNEYIKNFYQSSEDGETSVEDTTEQEYYDSMNLTSQDDRPVYSPEDGLIFEGGPTLSQVELWKKQFPNSTVFHVLVCDQNFVLRSLNRMEYKKVSALKNTDPLYREEAICTTCVLWPVGYDFKQMSVGDAGFPSTVASIIMKNSGFTQEYSMEVL